MPENRVTQTTPPPPSGDSAALADRVAELSPERRALLRKLLEERAGAKRAVADGIRRREGDGPVPLSFPQQRLWFIHQMAPHSPAYNLPVGLVIRGPLDAGALRRALGEIVRRHEALRTVFATAADGEPVQIVLAPGPGVLPAVDLAGLAPADGEREMRRLVDEEAVRPFDLARGPLLRASMLRLGAEAHVLPFTMHHIVGDGWSMGVLVNEVSAIYDAYAAGRPSPLPELPVQYADYAVWQRDLVGGERLERQLAWWRGLLHGLPPTLELPLDRARPSAVAADAPGGARGMLLPLQASRALRALARREGSTLFMTLLAAWQLLLARYAATEDVAVGTVVAGRSRVELEGLIGFFVNTLVLRTDLSGDPTFHGLLGRVRDLVLGAFAHQDVPFEKLVEELAPERALGRTPLFQVMFAVQKPEGGGMEMEGLEVEPLPTGSGTVKFDLNLTMTDHEEHISAALAFRADLFDAATAERMLEHFRVLLEGIAADPGRRIMEVPLLPAAERELVLERWNDTARPFSADETLHGLFARRAARDPEGTALVFGGETVSRAELDRRSARIAHALRRRGVGPESRVALYLEPSVEMVAALLGVLRAGGAYVPLDTAAPAERTARLLEDSAAELVLASPETAGSLPPHGLPVLRVTADAFAGESDAAPGDGADPANLAYVIYTSGSTGRPKGVMVPHRGVVNVVRAYLPYYRLRPGARLLLFAPLHFDASVLDLFTALGSGAALVVARREELVPGTELTELLRRHGVTHGKFTPSALAATPPAELPELEVVITGGESCSAEVVERWGAGRRFVNGYGPTETSVRVTGVVCADGARTPPIGHALDNVRLYVLDARGEPLPVGVAGELFIGGAGVTRGYLGRPDLTAERFLPDPFSPAPGERMYRSGDRVRRRADGGLDFVGRTDFQVKIRGFRVEPGEVEAALLEHPALADAVVAARDDGMGGTRLAAYVAAADGAAAPSAAELRAHLRERLPEYMVPASFTALPALPLTSSGKVDRHALPEPQMESGEEEYVAPRTPTEATLAAIWAEVLKLERVGARDEFFALGGHSLVATRVVARAREAFGVEVPLRAVFEAPTLAALAARVDELLRAEDAGGEAAAQPAAPAEEMSEERRQLLRKLLRRRAGEKRESARVRPRAADGPVPLSFAQQRLWFVHQMDPGSSAYNMPYPMRLRGALDVAVLERALTELVRRHESLRTVFAATAGEPVQVVRPPAPVRLPVADLSGLPPAAREAEVRRRVAEESARPFDLARGPLLRAAALRLGGAEWGLVFSMHHIVSDGWSTGVLTREVSALYGAFARGEPSPLPPLPVQYPDFALWQRERVSGEALDAQLRWWRGALAGAPAVLELPTDRPRPAVPGARADSVPFALPPGTAAALRELGRAEGATSFMVMLAAFQALLARWSGQDDVSVGSPVAGRDRVETEGLIGFFVNTLVLRADLSGDPGFRGLLARVREAVLGAFAHQDLPFEKLVEELRVERSLRHTPLFQVVFALQNAERGELRMGDLEVGGLGRGEEVAKFDLSAMLAEDGDRVRGGFSFRTDLFDRATVARMADHFGRLLEAVAADPDRRLSGVEVMGAAERSRVLEEWSRSGDAAAPPGRCVHELFAEQAARAPGAVALVAGDERITYAGLDARSAGLARALARRGVRPGVRVGICAERGPEMVVGMLAVLRAGGAYVPLDPAYPAERLAYMLADAAAPLLLTQERLRPALPEFAGEVVVLDAPQHDDAADEGALSHSRTFAPSHPPSPDDLAYVIYTSGSTGLPKGTEVPHRAVPGFFRGVEYARFDAGTVFLQHSSTSWDALTLELWAALLSGGTCVLYPGRSPEPAVLAEQVRRHGVNTLWLTSAYFNLVVDGFPEVLAGVAQVMTGGETVSVPHARRALELYPGLRLVDGYGPSETTVFASCFPVPAGFDAPSLPVGRPVGDRRVYLLDRHFGPVPQGVHGELCVGGPAVARGYQGRPALTAERFVPDPFGGEPGGRLYRSGDRARWRPDGLLEFAGRTDFQAKIRGFRVEPGEVEAVLAAHPAVREAVVLVREDLPGEKRLVGYAVPAGGGATAAELREHLAARLPEYMVPSALVLLEALPLSPNGKVDRRALPAPDGAGAAEYAAPRTPTEEILAGIWADVLRRERVGVAEDFFALGGHSLLATQVVSRAAAALGVEMPLRALFEAPTVAGLAVRADAALREGAGTQAPPIVPTPRDGSPLPLSFAQQRLWFIDQLEPGRATYNMPFPLRLRGALDPAALERALGELVRRHESLRTVFATVDGEPVQVVRPPGGRRLHLADLRGLPEAAREAEARRLAAEDAARPFDLARGPLLRTALVRTGEADFTLLVNMHHVVSDGWSMGVLTREVSALYGAFSRGEPSPLPELEVQYADYAAWQRAWLVGETLDRQIAFWKERLGGAPPLLELPTDHPRPAVASDRGAGRGFALSAEATAGLRALARREGATLFTVLLAGFASLLSRWAGQDDVLVGTPIAGRTRLETEALIGFFVNTLVIRADLSGEPDGRGLVARVRERMLEAHAHQDLPFERLVDELSVERSLAHAPLFQAMFTFAAARAGGDALELGGVEVEPLGTEAGSAKFDLTLGMSDAGERLAGGISFRAELWEGATVERMLGHLAALLEGLARAPESPVAELPLLGEAERAELRAEWSAAERPYPRGLRVHDLFRAQAARTPDAPAVSWRGGRTTYAELDRRAGRLASALRRRGVGPESRVGVCMSRTPELLVALLGVLGAGGAYVPLDPAYPPERLGWMVEDAGIGLVLTESGLAGSLPEGAADVLVLDRERDALAAEPDGAPESGALPENLAYVIFTSGSTGRPKGVMVRHSSVVVLLHWMREAFGDEERASVLFSTSVNFDVSVAEIFGTLAWGGKLVLVENALELPSVPAAEEVRYVGMVPTAAAELLRAGGIPASVRSVNLAGEAVPAALARAVHALGHVAVLRNLYGPTEDTVFSTLSVVPPGADPVPMGRPLANSRAYVLDRLLQPVPVGVAGELYLAGDGLARGYDARPELTAERFLPDPFGPAGSRMYRTMDRVRRRADGELEYWGRTDFQVKVRGFRVELGEVEAALARHPAVRETVAVVREDVPGDRRIVAYATPAGGARPDAAELRAHAARHLPAYMVPSAVVVLDALPLAPNGKTDRRALPAPERGAGAAGGGYLPPRDTLELALARIWEETLGAGPVGVRDNFFALGGHSLLAVRLMARVEAATGARLPLAALFTAPTVEQLAAELRRGDARDDGSPLVPIRTGGKRPPLFLVHPVGGDVLAYAPLARHLHPEQPVYGLRSRGLAPGAEPAGTVEEMARDYLAAIRDVRPSGPYRLGGWSMGGVVAHEMARLLEAAGERVERLVLIDAHVPALRGLAPPRDERVLVGTFAQDLGLPPELLPLPEAGEGTDGPEYVRRVLEGARAAGLVPPDLDAERVERLYAVFRANLAALYDYRPAARAGAATLLRAAGHDPAEAESAGWERLAEGGLEVRAVPGSHFGMVREPHAEALAREVERALEG